MNETFCYIFPATENSPSSVVLASDEIAEDAASKKIPICIFDKHVKVLGVDAYGLIYSFIVCASRVRSICFVLATYKESEIQQ